MYKCYDFVCTNPLCKHEFTDLVETIETKDGEDIITVCPKCDDVAQMRIGNPGHHTHVSWSKWRVDHV